MTGDIRLVSFYTHYLLDCLGLYACCIMYYKYKEKLVILQSIGIMVIKSKETRVVTYTGRHSSGHLIPNSF